MTYWARVDRDGPWFESDVLVGADSMEIRPLVATVPARVLSLSAVDSISDLGPGDEHADRRIAVRGADGSEVEIRGSGPGVGALIASLGAATAAATPAAVDAAPTAIAAAAPTLAAPAPAPLPTDAGPGPATGGPPDRGRGRAYPTAIVGALAFIVVLGFWNHRSNQQELREIADRDRGTTTTTEPVRSESASGSDDRPATTSTTPTTSVPVTVAGATTVAPSTVPSTTTTPAPTTSRPTTTRPPPPPDPSGPRLLTGTVALRQVQKWDAALPECKGVGALSDVAPGTAVVVRDAAGSVIAEGTLGPCRFVVAGTELAPGAPAVQLDGAVGGVPQFTLEIPNVADSDRYTVQVGRYDPVGFSRGEIGPGTWRMRMVISAR